ncbi:MAG: sigma-70 family RNA polymerase sigma factor [Vicinamibacterales bacterium]
MTPPSASSAAAELELALSRGAARTHDTRDIQSQVLQLFDACAPGLHRYVRACGLPPEAAEDVVQEAFLALFRHLCRDGGTENLRGWLVQVCYRQALKQRTRLARRRQRETTIERTTPEVLDPAEDPEASAVARQQQRRLQAVLQALPERDRQCLWLRAEGVTYREIAASLGMSLGAVAKAVARATVRLTNAVKE